MRVRKTFLLLLCVLLAFALTPASFAEEVDPGSCASRVAGDFDDDGNDDLAIGIPRQTVEGNNSAGAVQVIYGTASGLDAAEDIVIDQDTAGVIDKAESGDRFGSCLAAGDFNGDGESDLAIGIPRENIGTKSDAGAVQVMYGSSIGLDAFGPPKNQFIHQDTPGIIGLAEEDDFFGASLAVGDFDNDGRDDLAIGSPGDDVVDIIDAGAINVIYGANGGLATKRTTGIVPAQLWHQDSSGIADRSEKRDEFGASMASGDFDGDGEDDLAVGVPGQTVGGDKRAGAVHVLNGGSNGLNRDDDRTWSQDDSGIDDDSEPNDRFATSLASGDFDASGEDDLAVGSPFEDLGGLSDAGAVNVIYGTSNGLSATDDLFFTQVDTAPVDSAESADLFGRSLAAADFEDDSDDDLAIGAPGENAEAGAVEVVYGDPMNGLDTTVADAFDQDTANVGDVAAANDGFGSALVAGDFDNTDGYDLAIGVPGEDVNGQSASGLVNVIYSDGTTLNPAVEPDEVWHQDSTGINGDSEPGDRFGAGLG